MEDEFKVEDKVVQFIIYLKTNNLFMFWTWFAMCIN